MVLKLRLMDGSNMRGRPYREWCDDISHSCQTGLKDLSRRALNRQEWEQATKSASNT